MAVAKGIASGMPLGVTAARADVMSWPPGAHASTFGGNPRVLRRRAGDDRLLQDRLMANAADVGGVPARRDPRAGRTSTRSIGDVRGKGLMIGIELVRDRRDQGARRRPSATGSCRRRSARGLLVLGAGRNAIRLSPPLVLTRAQADTAVRILDEALADVSRPS